MYNAKYLDRDRFQSNHEHIKTVRSQISRRTLLVEESICEIQKDIAAIRHKAVRAAMKLAAQNIIRQLDGIDDSDAEIRHFNGDNVNMLSEALKLNPKALMASKPGH